MTDRYQRLTPRRIIALIILFVGYTMYSDAHEIKKKSSETMDYIFAPINDIMDNPKQTQNFNYEEYHDQAISRTFSLSYDLYKFQGEVEAGVAAMFFGFLLIILPTFESEKRMYKSLFNFVKP